MKRAATILGMLAVAAFAIAQQSAPTQQNQPAATSGAAQPAAAPAGKRPPQAKTQPEFDAYNAAVANQRDPAAMEKAADDFAAKYPDSELRGLLYKSALRSYQNANNGDKMSEMAQKLLNLDPDDPEALVSVAEVMAEHTRDTDLDKDQRYDQATKYTQHALETVDTDVPIPQGGQQSQIDAYKALLRSTAYSVLGTITYGQAKYPEAENYFRKSIDAYPSQPDPVVVLRLALALDKQARYPDALKEANRAVELTQEGTAAGTTARHERDRLVQLTGGSSPSPAAKPQAGTTPNPAPNVH
jgi:tetratricopeptide (TPR) repeat protein